MKFSDLYKLSDVKLDFGCGLNCEKGFIGVDREAFNDNVRLTFDMDGNKIPLKDNCVDEIACNHTLEHLRYPMESVIEFYRVLKPYGVLTIHVPYFAHHASSVPVHTNYWSMQAKILLDGSYHESAAKFKSVVITHKWGESGFYWPIEKIFDAIIDWKPAFYEKRLAHFFPFLELQFRCTK